MKKEQFFYQATIRSKYFKNILKKQLQKNPHRTVSYKKDRETGDLCSFIYSPYLFFFFFEMGFLCVKAVAFLELAL